MSKKALKSVNAESGVATVESAIIIVVFLMLVLGIIEFSILIFNASSLVEATRVGARYLIVNEPVVSLDDYDCNAPITVLCKDEVDGCSAVVQRMEKFYPQLQANNGDVEITYRCSATGNVEAPYYIYDVEVRAVNVEYKFITPGILGFDAPITLPDFKTTKLSEDLETVSAGS